MIGLGGELPFTDEVGERLPLTSSLLAAEEVGEEDVGRLKFVTDHLDRDGAKRRTRPSYTQVVADDFEHPGCPPGSDLRIRHRISDEAFSIGCEEKVHAATRPWAAQAPRRARR